MEQRYLDMDSKGIIPDDFDPEYLYIERGEWMVGAKHEPGVVPTLLEKLEDRNPGEFFVEGDIPESALSLLSNKLDFDASWIPFFESYGIGLKERIKGIDQPGNCILCRDRSMAHPLPAILVYWQKTKTAIHESVHAMRMQTLEKISRGEDVVLEELYADHIMMPLHNVYLRHPIATVLQARKMSAVRRKLGRCFGNMQDYALFRLKACDLDDLAGSHMDEASVFDYFKSRTSCVERDGYASISGRLRFRIMCEKLGL